MFTIPMHALPYPAVLHRTDGPHASVSRVREMRHTTPLDRLAQRIAADFDVALVEIIDERRGRSVVTGRCAGNGLPQDCYTLTWRMETLITGEDGPIGRLVLRERAARAWCPADQRRLEGMARLAGHLLDGPSSLPGDREALAS